MWKLTENSRRSDTILIHHIVASLLYCCCILHSLMTVNHRHTYMQPTGKQSSALIIDIAATYQGHTNITPNILAGHGLSGWGTVCSYFGIGKKTVINVLNKKNIDLSSIGFQHEPLLNYLKQGINFLLHCYGQSKVETLNDAQKKMWKYRVVKSKLVAPKLKNLPPTGESFFSELETNSVADSCIEMFVECWSSNSWH